MNSDIPHQFLDPNIPRKGDNLQRHLEAMTSESTGPPIFSLIEFNLSGLCNRKCVFCPRSDPEVFPNINQHLPVELYEKIMIELASVSYDGMLLYSAFGEPLLYKNIEILIAMSKSYCPNVRIESVTDGDFVTVEKLRALFDAGLDSLLISMYDGPHQEPIFREIIETAGLTDAQVILRKRWLPPEEHYGITLSNRAGLVTLTELGIGPTKESLKRPCYYPYYQMLVDYDGSVLLCPHDWGKKLVVGNLNRDNILDIWDSRTMKRVRNSLSVSDRSFAPCDKCDVDGTLMGESHFERWQNYYKS